MQADEILADEALRLADGADIHKVTGLVATYRSVAHESDGCGYLDDAVKDWNAKSVPMSSNAA